MKGPVIDPWGGKRLEITEKLIKEFGLKKFNKTDIPLNHYLFNRGILIAHRDFEIINKCIKEKKPFIQLTGIASSGPLHLGHKVDADIFLMFKKLGAKSTFVISDIDAYISRPDSKVPSLGKSKEIAVENIAHLLALGINKEDIYVQSRKEPRYYEFAFELSKKITENAFKAIYGHLNLGKISANLLQYADILHLQLKEYLGPMPSITGIGFEQDPHARATRDLARRLPYNLKIPSFIYFSHQSGLQEEGKMSSSDPNNTLFLSDPPQLISKKISKAFSGGRDTIEEHRRLGGIPEKDKAFEILFYHHPDSEFVNKVYNDYKSGKLSTNELKKICLDFLINFITEHQKKVGENKKTAKEIVFGK